MTARPGAAPHRLRVRTMLNIWSAVADVELFRPPCLGMPGDQAHLAAVAHRAFARDDARRGGARKWRSGSGGSSARLAGAGFRAGVRQILHPALVSWNRPWPRSKPVQTPLRCSSSDATKQRADGRGHRPQITTPVMPTTGTRPWPSFAKQMIDDGLARQAVGCPFPDTRSMHQQTGPGIRYNGSGLGAEGLKSLHHQIDTGHRPADHACSHRGRSATSGVKPDPVTSWVQVAVALDAHFGLASGAVGVRPWRCSSTKAVLRLVSTMNRGGKVSSSPPRQRVFSLLIDQLLRQVWMPSPAPR